MIHHHFLSSHPTKQSMYNIFYSKHILISSQFIPEGHLQISKKSIRSGCLGCWLSGLGSISHQPTTHETNFPGSDGFALFLERKIANPTKQTCTIPVETIIKFQCYDTLLSSICPVAEKQFMQEIIGFGVFWPGMIANFSWDGFWWANGLEGLGLGPHMWDFWDMEERGMRGRVHENNQTRRYESGEDKYNACVARKSFLFIPLDK